MKTEAFTIRTDPETIKFIDELSARDERSRNYIVNEALQLYIKREQEILEKIERGYAESEAGLGTEHEEFFEDFYRRHNIKP